MSAENKSLFKDTTIEDKIIIALMYVPVHLMVVYMVIRAVFDQKKRAEWIQQSNARIDSADARRPYWHEIDWENVTDEELAARGKEDELWWKENRVKMAFYTAFGMFLLPFIILINWLGRRSEAKKEKVS